MLGVFFCCCNVTSKVLRAVSTSIHQTLDSCFASTSILGLVCIAPTTSESESTVPFKESWSLEVAKLCSGFQIWTKSHVVFLIKQRNGTKVWFRPFLPVIGTIITYSILNSNLIHSFGLNKVKHPFYDSSKENTTKSTCIGTAQSCLLISLPQNMLSFVKNK